MTELTNIKGTRRRVSFAQFHTRLRQRRWFGTREGADALLMMVRTLAMRWMTLALMLASGPEPNAGSYEAGERLTRTARLEELLLYALEAGRRTSSEETVFGEDGDGVDEEDADCNRSSQWGGDAPGLHGQGNRVQP